MDCCKKDETVSVKEKTVSVKILKQKIAFWKKMSAILSLVLVASISVQYLGFPFAPQTKQARGVSVALASEVLPENGVEIPISWGDLGMQMVEKGVIDKEKIEKLYKNRGGMSGMMKKLLFEKDNGTITIDAVNANEVLNLFWAFGLSNKNPILDNGLMTTYDNKKPATKKEALEKAGRLASTGGWPLAVGNSMDHYSMYNFVELSDDQWKLVQKVSAGIYRPCCNNPTSFPDCNHGMAMLGLLELLAKEGLTEDQMFDVALSVNSYWFPDTYMTIAEYMLTEGVEWSDVDSKNVLGIEYSSGSGFTKIRSLVQPVNTNANNSCGA